MTDSPADRQVNGAWFAVDWGTTHLRAWLIDKDRPPVAGLQSDKGAGTLSGADFEAALVALTGPHLPPDGSVDVLCCGMVGSRQGWVEAPYREVPCPLLPDAADLARIEAGRLRVHVVPGVSQADPPDVMRGEETQIAGYLAAEAAETTVLCLPGTHSKWAIAERQAITGFKTFPTGELFSLWSKNSILRHSMGDGPTDLRAFTAAVTEAAEAPDKVLGALFPIRAADLLHGNAGPASRDRLSGLLIGLELANARQLWAGHDVVVIGAGGLAALYTAALTALGVTAVTADGGEMVRAGLIATRRHILGETS